MIHYPNEDTFENKRVKVRINNYPVVTGKSGLCRASLEVGVLVIASPQQAPPAGFSKTVLLLFSFAPEVSSLPLSTSTGNMIKRLGGPADAY